MGLLRTVFYAVIIYFGWKLVKNMFTIKDNNKNDNAQPPSGGNPKRSNDSDGEYVDYEDIK
ncbi:MAG: DUF4834 family protein [Bacteroidia bacterium]|jgi:hypothetical protein|nr:hypothetical protein [Bacteroidia bacterium]MCO5253566.1 DUF4834 family protein [Bacteroidota bacterium]MCZ2130664.1 DUF4834 family protein [Bacteroidia bacterium]